VATATRAAGGGPLWWPLAVGTVSIVALSAFGFAAGALIPSRFTAPLVVLVAFFGLGFSNSGAHGSHSVLLLSPLIAGSADVGIDPGVATFYPYLPDLSIVQLMFACGLTLTMLAALGLPARSGGWRLRAVAALVLAAGLACAGTAAGLIRTGSLDPHGMIRIPALHDAASGRPLRYTPVCAGSPVPVCMNPLYRAYLPAVVSAVEPLLREYAGLPGAPARLDQAAQVYKELRAGGIDLVSPASVSQFVLPGLPGVRVPTGQFGGMVAARVELPLVMQVLGLSGHSTPSPAQQALFAALTGLNRSMARQSGVQPELLPEPGSPADQAARRLAAGMSRSVLHTWLPAHITALRAGQLSLAQLP
jgi:hypothetical protein